MKLTAENRATEHHLSLGDAGRQRKEETSEQLYLFVEVLLTSNCARAAEGTPRWGEAVQGTPVFAHPSQIEAA